MSVKGTRRPVTVLKFGFYQGSAASLSFPNGAPLTSALDSELDTRNSISMLRISGLLRTG